MFAIVDAKFCLPNPTMRAQACCAPRLFTRFTAKTAEFELFFEHRVLVSAQADSAQRAGSGKPGNET
jgi:hypothetical protein